MKWLISMIFLYAILVLSTHAEDDNDDNETKEEERNINDAEEENQTTETSIARGEEDNEVERENSDGSENVINERGLDDEYDFNVGGVSFMELDSIEAELEYEREMSKYVTLKIKRNQKNLFASSLKHCNDNGGQCLSSLVCPYWRTKSELYCGYTNKVCCVVHVTSVRRVFG